MSINKSSLICSTYRNAKCAKYNIVLNCNYVAVIKDRIWMTFVDNDSRVSFH